MTYYVFTSITLNYVPKARVLAKTLRQHNPDVHFSLVLSEDEVPDEIARDGHFDAVVLARELGIPAFSQWAFKHTVVEMCTAVKGPYAFSLLNRPDCEGVLYFDPDMVVLAPITPLLRRLPRSAVLLTPHLTEPETTLQAISDNELSVLRHGIFNLGFFAISPSAKGLRFARWWKERLEHFCYDDLERGLFTDQKWIDLAFALFEGISVLRNPEYNVATWNLSHRAITGDFPAGLLANGRRIVFYHFSGFDSGANLPMLLRYGNGSRGLFDLRNWYIRECAAEGQATYAKWPWSYGSYDNGVPISKDQRVLYRNRNDMQEAFPDPFTASDTRSYLAWYRREVEEAA